MLHQVQFSKSVKNSDYDIDLHVQYVCDPTTAMMIANQTDNTAEVSFISDLNLPTKNPNGLKTILVIRHGAFGDLILTTPLLRHLRKRNPNAMIYISAAGRYAEILSTNPHINEIISYPPKLSFIRNVDSAISLEYSVGLDPLERSIHLVQLFARHANCVLEDEFLELPIPDPYIAQAWALAPKSGLRRVAIQVHASNTIRSYPIFLLRQVVDQLQDNKVQCILFSQKRELTNGMHAGCLDISQLYQDPNIMQVCALLSTCDAVCAPDSLLSHVATAIKKPLVALYGPFPSNLRLVQNPDTVVFEPKLPCSPCFHHTRSGRIYPENGPCNISGRCEVLNQISPTAIADAILKISNTNS